MAGLATRRLERARAAGTGAAGTGAAIAAPSTGGAAAGPCPNAAGAIAAPPPGGAAAGRCPSAAGAIAAPPPSSSVQYAHPKRTATRRRQNTWAAHETKASFNSCMVLQGRPAGVSLRSTCGTASASASVAVYSLLGPCRQETHENPAKEQHFPQTPKVITTRVWGGEGTIYKPSLTFHLGEGLNGKPNIGRVN